MFLGGLLDILFSPSIWVLIALAYLIHRKSRAPNEDDRNEWMKKEISGWAKQKIISEKQKQTLMERYPAHEKQKVTQFGTVKMLSIMSALLVGIGVLLFVASNWEKIPDLIRVITVLSVTFGTFYLGYDFSYQKEGRKQLGKALLLMASIFWGASIALIAQIYHIPTSGNWWIFLLWALPLLPVAYFLESRAVFLLSSGLLLVWNFMFVESKNTANYYYPLLVFAVVLPLAKGETKIRAFNIFSLLIAATFATTGGHDYVALLISVGLLAYYALKKNIAYAKAGAMAFLMWMVSFNVARPDTPNYVFAVPLAVLTMITYKENSKTMLKINLASFLIWFLILLNVLSKTGTNSPSRMLAIILPTSFIGVLYYIIGINHKAKEPYELLSKTYKKSGLLLSIATAYILSFKGTYDEKAIISYDAFFYGTLMVGALSVALLLLSFIGKRFSEHGSRHELIGIVAMLFACFLILLAPGLATLNTIAMNAFLLLVSVLLILGGFEAQSKGAFNAGAIVFAVLVLTRYFDTFWQLLPRSLAFIVGGLLLLTLSAYLERKRRKVIEGMKNE